MGDASGDRLTNLLKLAGTVFLGVAAVALFLVFRPEPTTFELDPEGFVDRWNAAAPDPRLTIGEIQWTDPEAGVFGYAFTPTLSVLARVEGPFEQVAEVAVVGQPEVDGETLVRQAMELVVAVTEPSLSPVQREQVLAELTVTSPNRPADPDARTIRGDTRYRVAADPRRGILGIGAAPAAAPETAHRTSIELALD